ncbi:MAG: S-layer homology domain-containing protein [Lachnospiraceae bacterium]|nr:S-layer homology domain-containing protein [Lachnospiraceae bacterium]
MKTQKFKRRCSKNLLLSVLIALMICNPVQAAELQDDFTEEASVLTDEVRLEEATEELVVPLEEVSEEPETVGQDDAKELETGETMTQDAPEEVQESIDDETINEETIDEEINNQEPIVDAAEPMTDEVTEESEQQFIWTEDLTLNVLQNGGLDSVFYGTVELDALSGEAGWQATVKQRLLDGYKNLATSVDVSDLGIAPTKENGNILVNLAALVMNENPQFFYAAGLIRYGYWSNGNITDVTLFYEDDFTYTDTSGKVYLIQSKATAYENAIKQALATVSSGMKTEEKLLAVHDYLTLHCEYDYTFSGHCYSAYGAMVDQSAVCQGYSLALADICKRLGITGYILDSEPMNHAWNMVYVDGNWYHMDATWDDQAVTIHDYFLKSDAEFKNLKHYDWKIQYSTTSVPVASKSNAFSNYIFVTNGWNNFGYSNGKWYYLDNDVITASTITGTDKKAYSDLGYFHSLQLEDGRFYFADYEGVYTAKSFGQTKPEKVWMPLYHSGYYVFYVTDMSVNHDVLAIELTHGTNYSTINLKFKTTQRETAAPQLTIPAGTAFKNLTYYTTYIDVSNWNLQLVYPDGKKITVKPNEKYISGDFTKNTKSTKYEAQLTYRILSTSFKFTVDPDLIFKDIYSDSTDWVYTAATYVAEKGYMAGTAAGNFAPDTKLQRCLLAQILYNMEGAPKVTYRAVFSDVKESDWFADAVIWAYDNGITSGYPNGKFGVYDNITREQLSQMLYKYAANKGMDVSGRKDLSQYSDTAKISDWAVEAMQWITSQGIMNGKANAKLDPRGAATRAEAATMIRNFDLIK